MPRLIRHPEQVMMELGTDLFFIKFKVDFDLASSDYIPNGFDYLKKWFNENFEPKTWELIGPSAFSGEIEGFIANKYAIYPMSISDINKYSNQWEIDSSGKSSDERWQAYLMSYDSEMEEKISRLDD